MIKNGLHVFPPRTRKTKTIDTVLRCLPGSVKKSGVIYVSAPITSGKRYLQWYHKMKKDRNRTPRQYNEDLRKFVIEPNLAHARKKIERLIIEFPDRQIIDPTAVDVPGWTQGDYACFWQRVIERFANQIVLLHEWQYSSGCSFEFLTASKRRIPIFNEYLEPLSVMEGARMISDAIQEIEQTGMRSHFLALLLKALKKSHLEGSE